jgi:hypothetical protein
MRVVTADEMLSWIVRNIHPEKAEEDFDCDCHWCSTYNDIIHIEAQVLKKRK